MSAVALCAPRACAILCICRGAPGDPLRPSLHWSAETHWKGPTGPTASDRQQVAVDNVDDVLARQRLGVRRARLAHLQAQQVKPTVCWPHGRYAAVLSASALPVRGRCELKALLSDGGARVGAGRSTPSEPSCNRPARNGRRHAPTAQRCGRGIDRDTSVATETDDRTTLPGQVGRWRWHVLFARRLRSTARSISVHDVAPSGFWQRQRQRQWHAAVACADCVGEDAA